MSKAPLSKRPSRPRQSKPTSYLLTALQDDRFTEHAAQIGIIISLWSLVERQLAYVYGDLLRLDHERSEIAFYAIQNYHTRRNTISAALDRFHASSSLHKTWDSLQPSLKKAHHYRNVVAHGIWEAHPKGGLRLTTTSVDGIYIKKYKRYSAHTLAEQAKEISILAANLNDLALELHT